MVNYTFYFRVEVNETKKVKNPDLAFIEKTSTVTQLLISRPNQKFNAKNRVTRLFCVAVLVIFNIFPCGGITGSV